MELGKQPKLASHFWPTFFKKNVPVIVALQIVLYLATGAALTVAILFGLNLIVIWAIIILFLGLNIAVSITMFVTVTKPTRDLLAAVIHASGEQPELAMPHPNCTDNEQTGLGDAIKTIYSLSGKQKYPENAPPKPVEKNPTEQALDITNCGFVVMDNKRRITYCNQSAPVSIGPDETKTLDLLFNNPDTLDSWLDKCTDNSLRDEHVWTRIPDRLPNEQGRRFFDVMASYQKDAPSETVLTLIDKTNAYQVDEENLDFMSFAAHELRGPITVIRGYLDVLQDELSDKLEGDQDELFHRLVISANRLSGYINNILNTSKYDRRHLNMRLSEGSISAVYDTVSDDMQMRAKSQNRLLTVNIPDNLPTIAVDINSLSEVFGNLIDNAIKYSNEGGSIEVAAQESGDFVELSVTDHGIGMPENVIGNLFQKFYRSHRSRETVAGTGIGLYISKAIVESHGGTISVHSEDGRGSKFTVAIPKYSTVAAKIKSTNNGNKNIINEGRGWIKNHSMYRG